MHFDLEDSRSGAAIARRLRHLPTESAPPLVWREFKRRQRLHRRTRAQAAERRQIALVAVVALVIVGATALWRHLPPLQGTMVQRMSLASPPSAQHPVPFAWNEAAARSLGAERWLAAHPAEPVIVRVGTRAVVTNLEDRIAWVDDTLTSMRARGGEAERARALQYERDRLINSLAQLRFAETLSAELP